MLLPGRRRKVLRDECEAFSRGGDGAFKLGVFGGREHGFEGGAGAVAGSDEGAPGDEGGGAEVGRRFLLVGVFGKFVESEFAVGT